MKYNHKWQKETNSTIHYRLKQSKRHFIEIESVKCHNGESVVRSVSATCAQKVHCGWSQENEFQKARGGWLAEKEGYHMMKFHCLQKLQCWWNINSCETVKFDHSVSSCRGSNIDTAIACKCSICLPFLKSVFFRRRRDLWGVYLLFSTFGATAVVCDRINDCTSGRWFCNVIACWLRRVMFATACLIAVGRMNCFRDCWFASQNMVLSVI